MSPRERTLAIIPAKAASVRLPGKNLRPFAGWPLVAHSIRQAVASAEIDVAMVSTDSGEIAAVARKLGAEVPFMRLRELSNPDVHATQPILDLIERSGAFAEFDYVVMLLPTCPLRRIDQVDGVARLAKENRTNVLSVVALGKMPFHLRTMDDRGRLVSLIDNVPFNFQHGDAEEVYALNGACYCAPMRQFMENRTFQYGTPLAFVMDWVSGIDIDTLADFELAEYLSGFGTVGHG